LLTPVIVHFKRKAKFNETMRAARSRSADNSFNMTAMLRRDAK
jgi:hypothetical protein